METEEKQQQQNEEPINQRMSYEELAKSRKNWIKCAIISHIIMFIIYILISSLYLIFTGCTPPPSPSPCFGAERNWLHVQRRGVISRITLSNLKIGDYAQSKNENDDIIWSKVWFINEHYGKSQMMQLLYSYIDRNKFGNLTLTNDHLLYRNNFELIRADGISIGDTIKLVDLPNNNTFIKGEIIDILYNVFDYARSPITMDGGIVVSSVLSSSYTKSNANAERLHKAARLFRDISDINTQIAAYLTNFFYNYIYKSFKAMSMEHMCEYYALAPIISAIFAVLMVQSFKIFKRVRIF